MKIEVTLTGRVTLVPGYDGEAFDPEAEIERVFCVITTELLKLVEDPIVSGSLATGEIEVTLLAEGETPLEAVQFADSAIRAAFHTAECITAGWEPVPEVEETPRMRVDWVACGGVAVDA